MQDWKNNLLWAAIGFVIGALVMYMIGANTAMFSNDTEAGDNTEMTDNGDTSDNMNDADDNMNDGSMSDGNGSMTDGDSDDDGLTAIGEGTIETYNQVAGDSVVVPRVELAAAGWVVVHEMRDAETIGNALGAAWFPAGVHENVTVELLRGTVANRDYVVVLYNDDGDREFELDADAALRSSDGTLLMRSFTTTSTTE